MYIILKIILGKRLVSIIVKSVDVMPDNEKKVKIKFLIKNVNDVTKNYMKKEIERSEPFIVESFKIFKKLVTNKKNKQ